MKKVLCKNCKAWESKADGSGFCRRKAPPPTVMPQMKEDAENIAYVLVVPSTMANDGCFEGVDE